MSEGLDGAHGADTGVPTAEKIEELYRLIDGIDVAMFTTRTAEGDLVSRPMQVQGHDPRVGADLWFVSDIEAHKLDELQQDPHVNVSFYRDRTREWVSVSGQARIDRDRQKVRELYKPDWRAWFQDLGGERDGGPDDPRITLIAVRAESVIYMVSDTPAPVVLFRLAKGIITGKRPDIGETRTVSGEEMHRGVE
jgi:general stress protein 26